MDVCVVGMHGCTCREVKGRRLLGALMRECSCGDCEGEDDKKGLICA